VPLIADPAAPLVSLALGGSAHHLDEIDLSHSEYDHAGPSTLAVPSGGQFDAWTYEATS
jgi:hypothetical protein